MEQIAARSGVNLARSTLAEWVGRIGVALQPLADRLAALLLEQDVLHADETPVAQPDPGSGRTRRAYLWAYCSNVLNTGPPIVVFDYQISRAGAHAQNFLANWKGTLMVDGFGGYKALFAQGVTELGCLAHARRKFFDLNAAEPNAIAQEALSRIAALYAIEALGREMTIAARTLLRREQAVPLLQSMQDWLLKTRVSVAQGGGTAKAMDYSLKRWAALSRYAWDGGLPIDNNPVDKQGLAAVFWRLSPRLVVSSERDSPHCDREKELAVYRFGTCGQTCGCDSEPAGDGETQRPRSGCLAARDTDPVTHVPEQPDRFVAAASR